ncbi:ribonuclease H-like domain-containing protein [Tanacetum coccineum]
MQMSGISCGTIKANGIYNPEKVLKMLDRVFGHKSVECTSVLHQPDGVGSQRGHLGSFGKLNGVAILNWIINVVSQDVYMGLVYSENAAVVWKELKETYDKVDGSIVYNLLQKINYVKKGASSVADYYHRLNSLWREFDALTKLPKCSCEVKSSLLTRDLLSEVKDAYNVVSREESRRGIPETSGSTESKMNATSFATKSFNNNKRNFNSNNNTREPLSNSNNRGPNPNLNFNPNTDFKGNDKQSSVCDTPSSFTVDQMRKLLILINDAPSGSIHANMASRGTFFNGNVWFNINFSRYYSANTSLVVKTIPLGWIIDYGENQHLTVSIVGMRNVVDVTSLKIIIGHLNGTLTTISNIGNIRLSKNVILYDVLVVPGYYVSLLSVNKLIKDSKMFVGFNEDKCYIEDLKREITLGTGSESGSLYLFDMDNTKSICNINMAMYFNVSKDLWHSRLSHPADQVLNVLKSDLNLSKNTKVLGELVHLDLWGLYRVTIREGFKYFLTIVDDYSRAVWVYLIKSKDEVFNALANYINLIHNQFDVKIKTVRSDNGTKFINKKMYDLFSDLGIIQQTSWGIPLKFWSDCVLTDVPSSVLNVINSHLDVRFYETVFPFKMRNKNVNDGTDVPSRADIAQMQTSEVDFATQLDDISLSEGNVSNPNINSKGFAPILKSNLNTKDGQSSVRRSSRSGKMLAKYNDYVVESNVKKAIGCKWLFKIKYKSSRDIDRYKARLVAKGFGQREGIDFDETFRPVDMYMTLPLGFGNNNGNQVCKLNKSLYGLKQAPRQWNAKLTIALVEHGFKQSKFDYSLYIKQNDKVFIALLVYVDDIVITRKDKAKIDAFKSFLSSKFMIKDLGLLKYFLGIEAKCPVTRKSVSGFCDIFGMTLVSWKSKKQATVSRSSTEAEYMCMASATCEIIWISNLLQSLKVTSLYPINLFSDSSSAIQIAANPVFHEKTKHFEIDVHIVMETILAGIMRNVKVHTLDQIAYIFTKALGSMQHNKLCTLLSLVDMFSIYESLCVDKKFGIKVTRLKAEGSLWNIQLYILKSYARVATKEDLVLNDLAGGDVVANMSSDVQQAKTDLVVMGTWDVHAITGRYLSTDFVLSDAKGNAIDCTAKASIAHNFLKLKEVSVYSIKDFVVLANKDEYQIFRDHAVILKFDGATSVRKISAKGGGFMRYLFDLQDLGSIELTNNKYLIDVVGYVTNVGRTTHQRTGSRTLVFYLADGSGESMRVKKTKNVGLYLVVLTAMNVKQYNSKKSCTLRHVSHIEP